MIIGAISDSHRETKVAASAIEWLLARGANLLVHAGDIVESGTLRLLRQSGKPYFAVLGNNDEALTEFKNEFNLYDEPFCTEFAGLQLKIMHHPFYLFDEESAAQNEADGLNLDANLGAGADRAANLNSNASANLAANISPDMNSKASSGADRAVNLAAPSLNANLSTPNLCTNLTTPNLGSNLTANSDSSASGEGKNRGLRGRDADKIPTIKIYGHTHYFAAAVDKNGALVLNPGEICGRKKRLFDLPVLWCKSENCAYFISVRSAKNYKATERKS